MMHAVPSLLQALLAIILKLIEQEQQQQQEQQEQQEQQKLQQQAQQQQQQPARWQRLEAFLRAQPAATSIPFIGWLADLEAGASGECRRPASCLWLAAATWAPAQISSAGHRSCLCLTRSGCGKLS
jgi:hypothetical protein